MSIITKSVITDFGGNIIIDQFHEEIMANSTIITEITGIIRTGDNLEIRFANTLNLLETSALDNLIIIHSPNTAPKRIKRMNIYPHSPKSSGSKYNNIASFYYNGSFLSGNIIYIDIISFMQPSLTSYDIQVIDRTNNKIIAQQTLNNTEIGIYSLGTISNIPTNPAIIQFLVKTNGNTNKIVTIQEIQVWVE